MQHARTAIASCVDWLATRLTGDPDSQAVAHALLSEVTSTHGARWCANAVCVTVAIKGALWGVGRYLTGFTGTLERAYPAAWESTKGFVDTLLCRVICHAIQDAVQVVISLTLAATLQRCSGRRLLPERFASYFELCNASCGVLHHRMWYIVRCCFPPIIQVLLLRPPKGTLERGEVAKMEVGLSAADLLAVEVLPSVARLIASEVLLFVRCVTGNNNAGSPSTPGSAIHLAWIASLAIFAPLGHLRGTLHIPLAHLAPLLLFAEVVSAKTSLLTWFAAGVIAAYYRAKGAVCSTVFPAAYLLVSAYDERWADEQAREQNNAMYALYGEGEEEGEEEDDEDTVGGILDSIQEVYLEAVLYERRAAPYWVEELAHTTEVKVLEAEEVADLRSRGDKYDYFFVPLPIFVM